MGWLFGRSRAPAPRPTPLPSGSCQFIEAWLFSVGTAIRSRADPDQHEGPLRTRWFVPVAAPAPRAFTICRRHATEFVRYMMITGRNVVAS